MRGCDQTVKERKRKAVTVPASAGNYASESICFGKVGSGQPQQSFLGVTVLIESLPADARVELWLPKVADASEAASDFVLATDYFYAGLVCVVARAAYTATGETASYGSATWPLAGYPGAALLVRSGGSGGAGSISATAF